jgi:non-homologous end joining protein Ku
MPWSSKGAEDIVSYFQRVLVPEEVDLKINGDTIRPRKAKHLVEASLPTEVYMRAIWKGSIAFGLVHIPVSLYPATESQSSISSNLLHKKDHSRIRYQRVSEATGKEVRTEEIVRGFEVERDNFGVISDDELKEAAPEKSAAIEIQEFVDESQIATLFFEKPYYLEPDVAQFVLRNRESLGVLKAQATP